MTPLHAIIRDAIGKSGAITITDFMELALQHPEYGYYRRGDVLGRSGDFITAPEISQLFGEMIGLWCAETWRQMGEPAEFVLLELGPGRGTLMQDALRATAKIKGFHQAVRLCLLESNTTFRKMQTEKLADHSPRHLDDLSQLPALPTLVIANEFFDALPIRQFAKQFTGWYEKLVDSVDDALIFVMRPINLASDILIPPEKHESLPGTVHEISFPSLTILRDLARHVVRHGGAALIIDYGYTEPCSQPTLQAVSGHQYAPILERPGEVDLTAHVDFGALRKTALAQDAVAFGAIGQGEFLRMLGIELRAAQLKHRATPEQANDIDAALRRLTDPSQMGTLFKVMCVANPALKECVGFL